MRKNEIKPDTIAAYGLIATLLATIGVSYYMTWPLADLFKLGIGYKIGSSVFIFFVGYGFWSLISTQFMANMKIINKK